MLIAVLVMVTLLLLSFILLVCLLAWIACEGDKAEKQKKEWETKQKASQKEELIAQLKELGLLNEESQKSNSEQDYETNDKT